MKNIVPNLKKEVWLYQKGYQYIAGVDEVGRGAWAGPVVAAAVILPPNKRLKKMRDSKKLLAKWRQYFYQRLIEECLDWAIGIVEVETIDFLGVAQASKLAMKKAVEGLKIKPQYLLVDAFSLADLDVPFEPIPKGDMTCFSIAAASIIAKVKRDEIMLKLAQKYPQYGFDRHKGYGTALHQQALETYGLCPIHRKSFKPIQLCLTRKKC